jgi:hypothetical protein
VELAEFADTKLRARARPRTRNRREKDEAEAEEGERRLTDKNEEDIEGRGQNDML